MLTVFLHVLHPVSGRDSRLEGGGERAHCPARSPFKRIATSQPFDSLTNWHNASLCCQFSSLLSQLPCYWKEHMVIIDTHTAWGPHLTPCVSCLYSEIVAKMWVTFKCYKCVKHELQPIIEDEFFYHPFLKIVFLSMQILASINLAVGLHPVFFLGVGHYELCNQKGYQKHSPPSLSVYVCVCVCVCRRRRREHFISPRWYSSGWPQWLLSAF